MRQNLLFGCIVLTIVGISTIRATSEQCNAMFEAVVQMRGNLTALLEEGGAKAVQKLKKSVFYVTNTNIDDDVQLRRLVCQIVNANSIDEMATAMRIPKSLFLYMYMQFKSNAVGWKMATEETLLLAPSGMLSDARRRAMRSFVNALNVAENIGLQRFNPPPSYSRQVPRGCHKMVPLGLQLYNDRSFFLSASPTNQAGSERFRVMTGIDIEDSEQIAAVLCKLGEVSDLTELAAVFNMPVGAVRGFYPFIVSSIRKLEGVIASGKVPPGVPEHVRRNMLNFLRGMQEVGLLDLTD